MNKNVIILSNTIKKKWKIMVEIILMNKIKMNSKNYQHNHQKFNQIHKFSMILKL